MLPVTSGVKPFTDFTVAVGNINFVISKFWFSMVGLVTIQGPTNSEL
jgi:hypothetical protein